MEAAGSPGASWELAAAATTAVVDRLMVEPQGPGAQVKPLHVTAHSAGQGGGTRGAVLAPPLCTPHQRGP